MSLKIATTEVENTNTQTIGQVYFKTLKELKEELPPDVFKERQMIISLLKDVKIKTTIADTMQAFDGFHTKSISNINIDIDLTSMKVPFRNGVGMPETYTDFMSEFVIRTFMDYLAQMARMADEKTK